MLLIDIKKDLCGICNSSVADLCIEMKKFKREERFEKAKRWKLDFLVNFDNFIVQFFKIFVLFVKLEIFKKIDGLVPSPIVPQRMIHQSIEHHQK